MSLIGNGGISIGLTPGQIAVLSALSAGLDGNNNIVGVWIPRSGTYAQMSATVLNSGELALITDRKQIIPFGDGSTAVSALDKLNLKRVVNRIQGGLSTNITDATTNLLGTILTLDSTNGNYVGAKWLIGAHVEVAGAGLTTVAGNNVDFAFISGANSGDGSPTPSNAFASRIPLPALTTATRQLGGADIAPFVLTAGNATEQMGIFAALDQAAGAGNVQLTDYCMWAILLDASVEQSA